MRIEIEQDILSQFPPGFAIGWLLYRPPFVLEFLPSSGYDRQLVVYKTNMLVPGDVAVLLIGIVKDLANTRSPIAILFEKL